MYGIRNRAPFQQQNQQLSDREICHSTNPTRKNTNAPFSNITNTFRGQTHNFKDKVKKPAGKKRLINAWPGAKPQRISKKPNNAYNKPSQAELVPLSPMVIDKPQPRHQNIDCTDGDDPQAVTGYVDEIYEVLFARENCAPIDPTYMKNQPDINERMRAILVDWAVAVHLKFKLLPETLFLTVNIMDRFLQARPIARGKLQLVAVTSMLIAAKYEEIYPPECDDFVYISDKAYTKEQILTMECSILNQLKFNLTVPTAIHFLRRFSKAAMSDWRTHTLSKYLIELPLLDLKFDKYPPSVWAASAVYVARTMLDVHPAWTRTLEHYTKLQDTDLMDCVGDLNTILHKIQKSGLKTIRTKYSDNRFGAVARISLVNF